MTDLPNSAADGAANAPTPDGDTPAGDPELAALVARTDAATRNAPAPGEPSDAAPADTSPTSEPGADRPVLPLAAAVTDGQPPARPRRRRSLALRFGVAFVLGLLLAVGVGAGALYAWSQQYEGRVLPGVRVGSTELGGLTREQAKAELASAYRFARQRADHAHRPGRADDDDQLRRRRPRPRTPRRWSTRHSPPAARASPSRTSSADPRPRSTA